MANFYPIDSDLSSIPVEDRAIDYFIPFCKTPEPILHHLYNVCHLLVYVNFHPDTPKERVIVDEGKAPTGFTAYSVSGGITNRLFVCRYLQYPPILVRLFAQHSSSVIHRDSELEVAKTMSNNCISATLLGVFRSGRLEAFIERGLEDPEYGKDQVNGAPSLTPDSMLDPDISINIADQLGRLHMSTFTMHVPNRNINNDIVQMKDEKQNPTPNTLESSTFSPRRSSVSSHHSVKTTTSSSEAVASSSILPFTAPTPHTSRKSRMKSTLWPTTTTWFTTALTCGDVFRSIGRFDEYAALNLPRMFRETVELKSILDQLDDAIVFCHNDLLSGNIIKLPMGFDWREYRAQFGLKYPYNMPTTLTSDALESARPAVNGDVKSPGDTSPNPVNEDGDEFITILNEHPNDTPSDDQHQQQEDDDDDDDDTNNDDDDEQAMKYSQAVKISNPNAVLFIDFEYGSMNFASYDIANCFNESCGFNCDWSQFPSYEHQVRFISKYLQVNNNIPEASSYLQSPLFKAHVEIIRRRVLGFVLASHLYWAIWAVIMASNKADINFDYLGYAKLRFDGYWLMKSSCLKEVVPLLYSRIHEQKHRIQLESLFAQHLTSSNHEQVGVTPHEACHKEETAATQQEDSPIIPTDDPIKLQAFTQQLQRQYETPNGISIVGFGMSGKSLQCQTIGASHSTYINSCILRLRPNEDSLSYQHRCEEALEFINGVNNYYLNEIGVHIDCTQFLLPHSLLQKDIDAGVTQLTLNCPSIKPAATTSTSLAQADCISEYVKYELEVYYERVLSHNIGYCGQLLLPITNCDVIDFAYRLGINVEEVINIPLGQASVFGTPSQTSWSRQRSTSSSQSAKSTRTSQQSGTSYNAHRRHRLLKRSQQRELLNAIVAHPIYQRVLHITQMTQLFKPILHENAAAVYESIEDSLADTRNAIYFIATPPQTHKPIAMKLLSNGKHVIIDKPFTASLKDSIDIIKVAQKYKRVVSCFQNRRYDSDFLTAQHVLHHRRELGDVKWIETAFQKGISSKSWKMTSNSVGGGRLFDLGAHSLDQLIQLSQGVPTHVFAKILYHIPDYPTTDSHAHLTVTFDNGVVGMVDVGSFTTYEKPRYLLVGDKATYTQSGMDGQEAMLLRDAPVTESLEDVNCFGSFTTRERETKVCPLYPSRWALYYDHMFNYIAKYEATKLYPTIGNHSLIVVPSQLNPQPLSSPMITPSTSTSFFNASSPATTTSTITHGLRSSQDARDKDDSSLTDSQKQQPQQQHRETLQYGCDTFYSYHHPSIIHNAGYRLALNNPHDVTSLKQARIPVDISETLILNAVFDTALLSAKTGRNEPVTLSLHANAE